MPFDPAVALQVQTPQSDPTKVLNMLSEYQLSQARTALAGQEILKNQMGMSGLADYRKKLDEGDEEGSQAALRRLGSLNPEVAKTAQGVDIQSRQQAAQQAYHNTGDPNSVTAFPEVYQTVNQALATRDENVRKQTLHRFDVGGRNMGAYQENPSLETWNNGLDEMVKSGAYSKLELAPHYNKPNSMFAARMKYAGMVAQQQMEASGETAANQTRDVAPTTSVYSPRDLKNPSLSDTAPSAPARMTKKNPLYDTVPEVNLDPAPRPGFKVVGQDPAILQAKEAALKTYHEETVELANNSAKAKGDLGIIRASLEKGNVPTSRLAPYQETAGALIYAVTGNLDLAKGITGMDPSSAEVMNKSSTKLGFAMARSLGAREAVQVVQAAFAANPNIRNTTEGNLVVTKALDAAAQYDIDKAKFGAAFIEKNHHVVNFDQWWNENHPASQYISKAVPYQPARTLEGAIDQNGLQNGVTYEFSYNGKKVSGQWDPDKGKFTNVQDMKR